MQDTWIHEEGELPPLLIIATLDYIGTRVEGFQLHQVGAPCTHRTLELQVRPIQQQLFEMTVSTRFSLPTPRHSLTVGRHTCGSHSMITNRRSRIVGTPGADLSWCCTRLQIQNTAKAAVSSFFVTDKEAVGAMRPPDSVSPVTLY